MSDEVGENGLPAEEDDPNNRRFDARYGLAGEPVSCRQGKLESVLRVRDLSTGGVSGFIDEPLAVGDLILIEFDRRHAREAEVRWVRGMSVGLRFNRPLDPKFVLSMHEQHAWTPQTDEFGF